MKDRSGIQGVASNPVLVGAVTVLVILVAVFLAYNANNGLPFVSTYDLKAKVPNAQADRRRPGRGRQGGEADRTQGRKLHPERT